MNDSGSPKSDALEAGDRYRRLRRGLSGGNDRKRRRFQFSLRTLLLFVLVWSVGFSWLGTRLHRAEKNREAEAEIQRVAFEIGNLGAAVRVEQESRSWLENLLDDPGVKCIAVVDFNSPYDFGGTIDPQSLPRRQITDTDLGQMVHASLKRLTGLQP